MSAISRKAGRKLKIILQQFKLECRCRCVSGHATHGSWGRLVRNERHISIPTWQPPLSLAGPVWSSYLIEMLHREHSLWYLYWCVLVMSFVQSDLSLSLRWRQLTTRYPGSCPDVSHCQIVSWKSCQLMFLLSSSGPQPDSVHRAQAKHICLIWNSRAEESCTRDTWQEISDPPTTNRAPAGDALENISQVSKIFPGNHFLSTSSTWPWDQYSAITRNIMSILR